MRKHSHLLSRINPMITMKSDCHFMPLKISNLNKMKNLLIILLVIIPFLVSGQKDTVIYFGPNGKLDAGTTKVLKKEIRQRNKRKIIIRTFRLEKEQELLLFSERIISKSPDIHNILIKGRGFSERITRRFEEQNDGLFQFTDWQDKRVKRTGITKTKIPLLFQGEVIDYYDNGDKKSVSVYNNNELISNENWKENGEKYIDNIFYSVEQEPGFLPGIDSLHIHVLETFRESQIDLTQVEGRITVGFVVMEDGTIDGIRMEKGLGQDLDELALKAMNNLPGEWQPAQLDGNSVRYYQLFPINFRYKKHDFEYLDLKGNMLYWEIN
jgi:hypothetical protein